MLLEITRERFMNAVSKFLAGKRYGFYVTILVSLLAIVACLVYMAYYAEYVAMMSWPAVITLISLAALSIILAFPRVTAKYAAVPVAVGALVAVLLYIRAMYNYVAVVMVSIDLAGFSPQFILCSVLFIVALIASTADIFFAQIKEEANHGAN